MADAPEHVLPPVASLLLHPDQYECRRLGSDRAFAIELLENAFSTSNRPVHYQQWALLYLRARRYRRRVVAQGVRSHFGAARYLENVIRSFISVELVDFVVAWSAELPPTDRDTLLSISRRMWKKYVRHKLLTTLVLIKVVITNEGHHENFLAGSNFDISSRIDRLSK